MKYVYRGRKFNVKAGYTTLPNGVKTFREIVEYRGAVAIIPLLEDDKIVLVRQYRPTIGRWIYEIPAGTLEEGEDPESCAKRELEEETGYTTRVLEELTSFYTSPGYSTELLTVYLAKGLKPGKQALEKGELLNVEIIPLDRVVEMIFEKEIVDGKTIASILYYYHYREMLKDKRR